MKSDVTDAAACAFLRQMCRLSGWLVLVVLVQACTLPPSPDAKVPGPDTRRIVLLRTAAVIVTDRRDIGPWVRNHFVAAQSPGDADGGSATPVAGDGYFLTADHVLARERGRNVFVLVGRGGALRPFRARIVWRDARADLALLHVPISTPDHYPWTPKGRWLPVGTPVVHGGLATGLKSGWGRLGTSIPPERGFFSHRTFKLDIPLQPGDSGGPVVDAYGRLVGINSAVEFLVPMETAFFIDSEGKRPNLGHLFDVMERDRRMRNKP